MRLGTRGSALALAQTRSVAEILGGQGDGIELVVVESSGAPDNDKERWTRALDRALIEGEVDIAVHSAKDVPVERPDGIRYVGTPPREDPTDSLCGAENLEALEAGARVGTSSPRRAALISALREDLDVVELRGNVDTRLRALEAGECEAAILATAGLRRLGRADQGNPLDSGLFMPAAGQGTILLEGRSDDEAAARAAATVTDRAAASELAAERALICALEADCHTAVGALARVEGDGIALSAVCVAPDGSRWIRDSVSGGIESAADLGRELAERMLGVGAGEILAMGRGETE